MQYQKAKRLIFLLLIIAGFFSVSGFAASSVTPLPVDQAFMFSASFNSPDKVLAQWDIAPGYYLYQQKLHINLQPDARANINYPQGEMRFDQARGRYDAYSGVVSVPVLLNMNTANTKLNMSVDYQGCSEGGFCYPPIHKEFLLDTAAQSISELSEPIAIDKATGEKATLSTLVTDQNKVDTLLANTHFGMLMLIFTGLGLLLAFTPCVLPMIPILTGIIIGHRQPLSTGKAFLLSLTYVMGSAITYALAGVAAALMGGSLQAWLQQPWVIAAVSCLFFILALSLFGLFDLQLPRLWQHYITAVSRKQQSGTYPGVFVMGMVSTLIVSPCVTAPLVGVLMYIGETGDIILGAAALFAMGIGMGIPLLLIGVSARKVLPKSGPWMMVIKQLFGVMMLAMAVWMFSRISSMMVLLVSLGCLLLCLSILFGIYLARSLEWQKIYRAIGYVTGISGILLIAGGMGVSSFMGGIIHVGGSAAATENSFILVQNIADLTKQLSQAQAEHKPVLLDFYADWCESCVSMDKNVFSMPDVRAALSNFVLLRADLTANNDADEVILKNYAVVAPPTVLFFNNDGREVNSRRIVGEVNEKEFIGRVTTFMSASCDKKLQC